MKYHLVYIQDSKKRVGKIPKGTQKYPLYCLGWGEVDNEEIVFSDNIVALTILESLLYDLISLHNKFTIYLYDSDDYQNAPIIYKDRRLIQTKLTNTAFKIMFLL